MSYQKICAAAFGLMALLAWGAIELVPETLFFPVVEYSMPGNIQFAMMKTGELDRASCEQTARKIADSLRAVCADCKYVESCPRGLSADRKKVLSREALVTPSLRTPGNGVTMTISAEDPGLALDVCKRIEQQSGSQPVARRARCYPALAER